MKFISLYLLFISSSVLSQSVIINGIVADDSSKGIPYAGLSVPSKNIYLLADEEGEFSISFEINSGTDSLFVSCLGYKSTAVRISDYIADHSHKIILKKSAFQLNEFTLNGNAEMKTFGNSSHFPGVHGCFENPKDSNLYQVAQLIETGNIRTKILSAHLFLTDVNIDSGNIRITFYSIDSTSPSENILFSKLFINHPLQTKWVAFDFRDENLILDKDFFISYEFLPAKRSKRPSVFFGGTLQNGNLYERQSFFHHWKKVTGIRMSTYITAQ